MSHLRLIALGRLELTDESGADRLREITQQKRLALFLYLALARPPRFHRRDTLTPLFWPELDGPAARSALRQAAYYLRTRLGSELLVVRGVEEVGLDWELLSSDVLDFERAVGESRWSDALTLQQGPLVPGFHCPTASPDFSDWLDRRRRELRRQATVATRAIATSPVHHLTEAVDQVRQAIDLGSCDEGLVRELMRALARAGDDASALRLYQHFAERMRRDLELEPSPPTRRLADDIRQGTLPPTA